MNILRRLAAFLAYAIVCRRRQDRTARRAKLRREREKELLDEALRRRKTLGVNGAERPDGERRYGAGR